MKKILILIACLGLPGAALAQNTIPYISGTGGITSGHQLNAGSTVGQIVDGGAVVANKPLTFSWAAGMNLSGLSIPLYYTDNSSGTVGGVFCRPETVTGGTGASNIQVFYAASGTALASGTRIDTTACNANTGATVTQAQGVTTSAVPASVWIGVVIPTNTNWTSSTGSGSVKIGFTQP